MVDYRGALTAIEEYWMRNGYPPTYRELAAEWGLNSTCTVSQRIKQMERLGMVRVVNGHAVPIRLLERVRMAMRKEVEKV